jgi:hypothetical protein
MKILFKIVEPSITKGHGDGLKRTFEYFYLLNLSIGNVAP